MNTLKPFRCFQRRAKVLSKIVFIFCIIGFAAVLRAF